MNLYLCAYNNYFNRKLKVAGNHVEDYLDSEVEHYKVFNNINFNPNDGINTEHIFGNSVVFLLHDNYDYLLVSSNGDNIDSRWFIIESQKIRGGQYKITLKRDVIADYSTEINYAPIYIEKAIIKDPTSPLLLNNESMRVNQIKVNEILIKDTTDVPWLCMYLKKGTIGGAHTVPITYSNNDLEHTSLVTTIDNWEYFDYTTAPLKRDKLIKFGVYYNNSTLIPSGRDLIVSDKGSFQGTRIHSSNLSWNNTNSVVALPQAYLNALSTMKTYARTTFSYGNDSAFTALQNLNGKIIEDNTGKYFKVRFVQVNSTVENKNITTAHNNLYLLMKNTWNTATGQTATPSNEAFKLTAELEQWQVFLEEQVDLSCTINFASTTASTVDNPLYDIIALPYGETVMNIGGVPAQEFTYTKQISLAIMNDIAKTLTSSLVLDLQLLPYCPFQNNIVNGEVTMLSIANALYAKFDSSTLYAIPVVEFSNFTFNIDLAIEKDTKTTVPSYAHMLKYLNDCVTSRLCSPNYNGIFEFNFAKNGGEIKYFNVDMTLKPYTPYIHINPNFEKLYGRDFNDARGLICGGDFSLGIINDAWNQYEIQNKNYQNLFDRQIQNLEVNNSIARLEAGWQAVTGVAGGAAAGAVAGGLIGGPGGAVAGAAGGALLSAIGGKVDLNNLDKRMAEQKDYAIDNYNMSLQNIKALPYSITKVSALTANNKLFPFLEIYDCTMEEEEAYFNKIKYDGMTVGVIGYLGDYKSIDGDAFFKGSMIRNDSIEGDTHLVNEIYTELMKGIYI